MTSTIYQLVKSHAEKSPNAVAIAAPGRLFLTYGKLLSQIDRVVTSIHAIGVGRNDRVALVLPNKPELAVAFLAIASSAACAPLNPAYRESEFDFYLSDLNARCLVIESGADSPAIAVAQRRGIPIVTLSPLLAAEAGIFTVEGAAASCAARGELAGADDVALVLHTSGTTARPKRVPLTHRNLLTSAGNVAAALSLNHGDRCLNVMPLYHIHGLVGAVLASLAAGASVAVTPDFDSDGFFDWLEELQPTWYTAVPTLHQGVLRAAKTRSPASRRWPLRFVRSSSAALPLKVKAELEELFNVPVIEAYGMTEASHQIASNPLPPRPRKAGSVGVAVGSQVGVMDSACRFLPAGEIGEIVIRGANITSGYEGGTAINQAAFIDGWLRTGDQGFLDADGYLFLTGRLKELINRGGEKISPFEVESVLMAHPAIAEAVAFPLPHLTLGEEVAVAVVLNENHALTEGEIQRSMVARLADFKIPRRIVVVDKIPKGPTGKVQRVKLAEQLAVAPGSGETEAKSSFVPPRTELEAQLTEVWQGVLGVPVGIHDNFFELAGDSLAAAQVINRVSRSLQVELSFRDFFDTPTVAGMAGSVASGKDPASHAAPVPRLGAAAKRNVLPLSFSQQRLWFLDQLEAGNPVYNRPLVFRLTGDLQVEVLERCLNEIVRRHEILRTIYPAKDGVPEQVIAPALALRLSLTDLENLPDTERECAAQRLAIEEARRPVNLSVGPLLRARLIRLNEQAHLLLLLSHHIAADGWSDGVFLSELTALYEPYVDGAAAQLAEPPLQYADYALWQRARFEQKVFAKELNYWKARLENPPAALNLPTDRPRPLAQSYRGARQSLTLPPRLSEHLKEFSRREQVTLFMTLLAAFKTLLYRYSGQADILIGVPVSGRSQVETEKLIGVFINTLVLRTDLSGNPTFRALLGAEREVALEAFAHQELPFEMVVDVLQPDRELSRTPLFQVMFQLRNPPQQAAVVNTALRVDYLDLDIGVTKFDLTLDVIDRRAGLECRFEFSTDLFDAGTIGRWLRHYENLLEGIVADPEQRLSELPLLSAAEHRQLLVQWHAPDHDYPKDKSIQQLFETQVEQTPDAVAVVFEDQRLSYRELNRRANQLAHYLRRLGVGPEVLVGLCVERSLEMVIGLLAIVKAGGAYVPLDPAYPKDRLAFILADAKLGVVLTQKKLLASLPAHDTQIICLDTPIAAAESDASPEANPVSRTAPDNLCYVIYTSGSTGKPKGVLVTHANVTRLFAATDSWFQFNRHDVWTLFHSYAFDFSVWEIWGALLFGGRLVVVPYWVSRSPEAFAALLQRERVTVLNQTPSAFRQLMPALLAAGSAEELTIRFVIFGGEALELKSLQPWFDRYGDERPRLINMYGITETTVHVTYRPITGADLDADIGSVIGKPIPDLRIYLLDQHRELVPIGVPGEMYVGGAGVARGYLQRPELTAERFIADPFSQTAGARAKLYRSGDLARRLPNGDLEYLGRIDDQVKIRGFRIELGEIEAALNQHPGIRETAVIVREDTPGDKRLVAYIVGDDGAAIDEIRNQLRATLPEYMLPAAFVRLPALPLTANGKVDRRALPLRWRPRLGYLR